MLKIDNRRIESQIKEILQRTPYASAQEYLGARVARDLKEVLAGRKLL